LFVFLLLHLFLIIIFVFIYLWNALLAQSLFCVIFILFGVFHFNLFLLVHYSTSCFSLFYHLSFICFILYHFCFIHYLFCIVSVFILYSFLFSLIVYLFYICFFLSLFLLFFIWSQFYSLSLRRLGSSVLVLCPLCFIWCFPFYFVFTHSPFSLMLLFVLSSLFCLFYFISFLLSFCSHFIFYFYSSSFVFVLLLVLSFLVCLFLFYRLCFYSLKFLFIFETPR